jgi:hypothetical protein
MGKIVNAVANLQTLFFCFFTIPHLNSSKLKVVRYDIPEMIITELEIIKVVFDTISQNVCIFAGQGFEGFRM